jgi:phosphohistidine phosphatase
MKGNAMQLYIVRHGPAGDASEWTSPDRDRPLTTHGKNVVLRVAEKLAELGVEVDAIITSPYVRAKQTADILARALHRTDQLETDGRLSAGFGIADLMSLLADYAEASSLMIVGHEPDLGQAICELVGAERLKMKKGAVALVDVPDPHTARGQLQWVVPPAVLVGDTRVLE